MTVAGWLEYEATSADGSLENVLVRYGHIHEPGSDPELCRRIWTDPRNESFRERGRRPYALMAGDTIWLPPVDRPVEWQLRFANAAAYGGPLSTVVATLRGRHGPSANEPLAWPADTLTPQFLYDLYENIPFRRMHPEGHENITSLHYTDRVAYYVRPRRQLPLTVSPSDDALPSASTVTVGLPSFDVRVRLDMPEPVMRIVERGEPLRRRKARFVIEIRARGATQARRTVIRVIGPNRIPYYEEVHTEGALVEPGEHTWEWDGFGGTPERRTLDTRILRGRLTLEVLVSPARGTPGYGSVRLANRAHGIAFMDAVIVLSEDSPSIELYGYLRFSRLSSHWITYTLLPGLACLVAGAVVGLEALVLACTEGVWAANPGSVSPERQREIRGTFGDVFLGTALGIAIAGLLATLYVAAATPLSEADFQIAKGIILQGFAEHWSRNGMGPRGEPRGVTLGGTRYAVFAQASEREHDSVDHALGRAVPLLSRGFNLAALVPGLPTVIPVELDELHGRGDFGRRILTYAGGHEIGHATLREDRGVAYSMTHKGTSSWGQSPLPTAEAWPPAPAEIDLMKYYRDDFLPDQFERVVVAEDDLIGVLRNLSVEWRVAPS